MGNLNEKQSLTMNDPSFPIFEPDESKKSVSKNSIMFCIFGFALLFFSTVEQYFTPNEFYKTFKSFYLICATFLLGYWIIAGFWTYWIFRCIVRHDSATKYTTHSGAKYASIPLERLPIIPLQSTPLC
jgi:hypothetical protein